MPQGSYSNYTIHNNPNAIKAHPLYNDRPYVDSLPDSCWYYGHWYTPGDGLYISPDGWVSFDDRIEGDGYPHPPVTNPPIPNSNPVNELTAVLWEDYNPTMNQDTACDTNRLYYLYDTTSNILTVEWYKVRHNHSLSQYTFLMTLKLGGKDLLETDSIGELVSKHFIHFMYNTCSKTWNSDSAATGIEDATGTKGIYYEGTIETQTDSFHVIRAGYKGPATYIEEQAPLSSTNVEASCTTAREIEVKFTLSISSRVTLYVFDAAGRLVETLVNDNLEAGMHSITWEAADVSRGVYFLRLVEETRSGVRKVVVY